MTTEQIKQILVDTSVTLRMISENPEYQKMIKSETFNTSNDLTLSDAIQAINETWDGIVNHEYEQALNKTEDLSEQNNPFI
jgi:type IV secretory pathway VirB6-like protein